MGLNDNLFRFWDSIDVEFGKLDERLTAGDEHARSIAPFVRDIRRGHLRFRIIVLKYIPETDSERTAAYERQINEIMNSVSENLARLTREIRPEEGGKDLENLAKQMDANAQPVICVIWRSNTKRSH